MALVNPYLWISTLNINGLDFQNKVIEQLDGYINKSPLYAATNSLQLLGHTLSQSEEMEKEIPYKQKPKRAGVAKLI